jgi:sugar phosphate isomerase/epimerase
LPHGGAGRVIVPSRPANRLGLVRTGREDAMGKNFLVGMTAPADRPDGIGFAAVLDKLEALGVDSVELPFYGLDLFAGGKRRGHTGTRLLQACRSRPYQFTAHLPLTINFLDDPERLAGHFDILQASLALAAEAGARHAVVHTGIFFPGMAGPIGTAYARQRDFLYRAGEKAKDLGLVLCVENLFLWGNMVETASMSRLAEELERIGHSHVRATLDVSHGYLHCAQFGLDFLAEAARLAPHACHLHIHDSFGRPELGMYVYSPSEALAYGIGDLHLSVGQGSIPFDAVMAHCQLPATAVFNIELNERYFADEAAACLAATRRLAWLAASAEGHP